MKNRKKTAFLFYCVLIAALLTGITGTSTKAKEFSMDVPSLKNSVLHSMYTSEEEKKVQVESYDKNILHADKHTLLLKNVTEGMSVSFKSSDTSILSVKKISNSKCRYSGTGYGKADIIISVQTSSVLFFWSDEETYRVRISVSPHATSVKWTKSSKTITVGKKVKLGLTIRPSVSKEVPVFRSKNKKIVTINAKGQITGKKPGKTYVTARIDNGKIARCRIVVKKKKAVLPENTGSPKPTSTIKPTETPKTTATPKATATPRPTDAAKTENSTTTEN